MPKQKPEPWSLALSVSCAPDARSLRRFMEHVEPDPNSACVLWMGACDQKGYGNFWCNLLPGKTMKAHRFSWLVSFGSLPQGKQIDHICCNRRCITPGHLRLIDEVNHGKESANRRWGRLRPAPDDEQVL